MMMEPKGIAAGLAKSLLKSAGRNANTKLLIQDAFGRGFRLGLSMRSPAVPGDRPLPTTRERRHDR